MRTDNFEDVDSSKISKGTFADCPPYFRQRLPIFLRDTPAPLFIPPVSKIPKPLRYFPNPQKLFSTPTLHFAREQNYLRQKKFLSIKVYLVHFRQTPLTFLIRPDMVGVLRGKMTPGCRLGVILQAGQAPLELPEVARRFASRN